MKTHKIWASLHPFFEDGEIMGRSVANEEFIKTLLALNPYDAYHFYLPDMRLLQNLQERLSGEYPAHNFHFALQHDLPEYLARQNYHVFHLSDWVSHFVPLAALRNRLARNIFPITGPVHSLSYARYHAEFLRHLWPGCTERDAIVVTSRAGESVVRQAFNLLRAGYGLGDDFVAPRLRRLPLGIAAVPGQSGAQGEVQSWREAKRADLGLAAADVALLCLGRISHTSKMDLLPLLRAVQRLGRAAGGQVDLKHLRLILAGWTDPGDDTPQILAALAANLGLRLDIISRPSMQERSALYAAADIFVSPSDNLQETFGLTILEAGAFGLPVVASDFDGYRDLIEDGETGLLVSSIGPRASSEVDLLAHLWFDSQYHLHLAQQTALSVPALAKALGRLIASPDLRRQMGEAARKRVQRNFVWSVVLPRYIALWDELAATPIAAKDDLAVKTHPMQLSYAKLFKGHFEQLLDDELVLRWTKSGEACYRGLEAPLLYAGLEAYVPLEILPKLLFLARKPAAAGQLTRALSNLGLPAERADFLLLWALKHDFLEIVRGGQEG